MLLRAAEPRDFHPIADLNNLFIATSAIHFSYDPVTPDELEAAWRATRERYPWIVAEIDGRFAGYAKAGTWRDRAAYAWTPESGIYVEDWARRRGVGRALYLRLFDVLRDQGYHSLIGGITLPNEPSVRLHESVGFTQVSLIPRAGWKFNAWHDVGFWQRNLAEPGAPATPIRAPVITPTQA